ncbi:MAG: acyl-CoA dehydrogenase family protein, partial [Acidimicrobiales bacterium]
IWCIVDSRDVTIKPLPSLDPTRWMAEVTFDRVSVPVERQLLLLSDRTASDFTAAMVAAECTGGMAWCLDTASSYAKVREQFGRPIGQFQAVKHRLADMLVALEQASATAWDAAVVAAVAADGQEDSAALSSAVASVICLDGFVDAAKGCIQVLGGIGFTWEHDAHIYLKRALSLRQYLGGTERWRREVAGLALEGARRSLAAELVAALPAGEADERRDAVSAEIAEIKSLDRNERRTRLAQEGYIAPHWPRPWGRDAGAVEQLVIDDELERAGMRRPHLQVGAWALPTIIAYGTPEQQERWVRPTLLGELSWCQMFSEPGAGSDLANLSTKASRVDGGWRLSGQKVWTSMAGQADLAICLARTNPNAAKHDGITYFILDMKSDGIEIRPLRELTGAAMFNEVFLADVFVADDCVVGEVDGGWQLARTTLANERVSMSSGSSFGGGVEGLLDLVSSHSRQSPVSSVVVDQVGAVVSEAQSLAVLGHRSTLRALSGVDPGPESSVRKLLGVEHEQRVQELGLTLLGPEGATTEGDAARWTFGFLANRCLTIAGGTSEVQRNLIAERLLGLPRDPEPGT